jgi:hypothetical protein
VEGPCLLQKTGRELVALRSDLTGHQLHSKMRELARAAARDCSAPEFDRRALPDGDARAASLLAGGRNLPLLL